MPIKVELSYNQQVTHIPDVDPLGVPLRITHFDAIKPYIVVVSCNPDDQGGLVYRDEIRKSSQTTDQDMLDLSAVAEIEAVIAPTGLYEREIQTKYGGGLLKLTHFER